MKKIFKKILDIFYSSKEFILITHLNPDIDGISSMLTIHLFLKSLNKTSYPLVEEIPDNINFLPFFNELILIENFNKKLEDPVVIVLDAHSPGRIHEKIYRKVLDYKIFLIIDHHQKENKDIFSSEQISLIDSSSPSTTFLVYKILKKTNFKVSPEMAQNLLAGLYYDTGGFKYENVNKYTFKVASELCNLGANPYQIASHLFENLSLKEIEVLKMVLERLEFLNNGNIVLSYLTYHDLRKINYKNLRDFANFLRTIRDVKVAVFIKEIDKNIVSVSLRSKPPIEIIEFAKIFGGGGHKYASGFRLKVKNFYEFLYSLKKMIQEYYGR